MKAIPYGRQNITDRDIEEVVAALKGDFLTQGPKIKQFEDEFKAYSNADYAVAVSNGTAALHLAVMALDLKLGDKVITTPITFAASANCIQYVGAEVVFADIDPDTYLIDLNHVEELLKNDKSKSIKGVIPVDFAGLMVDLERLKSICSKYKCWIIEDACHAPGAYFIDSKGKKNLAGSGEYSDISVFSFHPVKHIACGEGGMITTNNHELYKKLSLYRTHGITRENFQKQIPNSELQGAWYYEMQELGYNYRITDFQCALGSSQLVRADEGLLKRNEIAQKYRNAFEGKLKFQKYSDKFYNALHLFVIEVEDRLGLYNFLRENNIYSQVHYIPVHLMPYYQNLGWKAGDLPLAEAYYTRCLSLPMYPTLLDSEQDFVIEKVLNYISK